MTYRFNGSVQPENFLLQQMKSTRFSSMSGKRGGTGAVNTIHPVLKFNLLCHRILFQIIVMF